MDFVERLSSYDLPCDVNEFWYEGSYDQAQQFFDRKLGKGLYSNLLSSAVSGFCCAFASLPFDLMKNRLMYMKADPVTKEMPYKNLWDCFIKIFKNEGITAYWKGFWTYYFRCAPHAMIILLVNEALFLVMKSSVSVDV